MEMELLEKIPATGITRANLLKMYPSGKDNQHVQRTVKSALSNLERQLATVKRYEKVPNRKRSVAYIERVHEEIEPMSFEDSIHHLVQKIGPIKPQILRFYVSRPVEELAEALRVLEASGKISKVVALQPDPEVASLYCLFSVIRFGGPAITPFQNHDKPCLARNFLRDESPPNADVPNQVFTLYRLN